MNTTPKPQPQPTQQPPLELVMSNTGHPNRSVIKKRADHAELTRLFNGVYVDATQYEALSIADKYRTRAAAFLETHPRLKPWGITAAALQGAPVLRGAPLHFQGEKNAAQTRQEGCLFHAPLPEAPPESDPAAQLLYECASSSPLADTLMAVNFLMRSLLTSETDHMSATRQRSENITETLFHLPLDDNNRWLQPRHHDRSRGSGSRSVDKVSTVSTTNATGIRHLDPGSATFTAEYDALRAVRCASAQSELLWIDFARLCEVYHDRRGIRKALLAGLYFSDQVESPAESLLIARCVELGFAVPLLQVSIMHPSSRRVLGRVDGLWPSAAVRGQLFYHDSRHGRQLFIQHEGDNDSIVIEFDGRLKYGEQPVEVLERERLRQNEISNLGYRFVRVGWQSLINPEQLRSALLAAHVPHTARGGKHIR